MRLNYKIRQKKYVPKSTLSFILNEMDFWSIEACIYYSGCQRIIIIPVAVQECYRNSNNKWH